MILHNAVGPPPISAPAKRTPLNKRVAYPADSVSLKNPSNMALADGPPVMAPVAPPMDMEPNSQSEQKNPVSQPTPLPPTNVVHTAPPTGGVVLFPPTSTTDIPKFTAPIIVPTMNQNEALPVVGSPTATNPITNTQVSLVNNAGDDLGIPNFDDDTQMFHYTLSKLQKTLLDVQDRLQPKVVEVIKKKLEIFSSMWESGSISYEVKSSMARLSTALHRRRCDMAHDIHMALMMDFVSEVGQWMVGIKRLIQEARGVQAPLSPTDTTISPTETTAITSQPVISSNETTNPAEIDVTKPDGTLGNDNLTATAQDISGDIITEQSSSETQTIIDEAKTDPS